MNVRRRSGLMDHSIAVNVANTRTKGVSVMSQTKTIKNSRSPVRAVGPSRVTNARTAPKNL